MAINNPYAAYQKYATVKTVRQETRQDLSELKAAPVNPIAAGAYSNQKSNANPYLESNVMTATPEELTLMLYDGAIKFMNQAVVYIEMNSIEKAHHTIVRAQDIFVELMSTLDMKYEVSGNLFALYDFIKDNLIKANLKKDKELVKEMIEFTRELRETWAQAMKIAKKG